MKNTKRKPRENCIVCENKIYRAKRRGGLKERRHNFALTCSRKCARIYKRIQNHVWNYQGKIMALKKRIKELENKNGKK